MWMNQMVSKTKLTQKEADLLIRYLQSLRANHSENGNGTSHR
jgi:hypothetical protein